MYAWQINTQLKGDFMKKKLLSIMACILLLTGCGKIPKLENGEEVVAEIDGKSFTANELYDDLKTSYGTTFLVNMIDNYIANKEIETDDSAKEYAKNELENLKKQYELYQMDFEAAMKQAGYETEDQLLDEIILQYKKDKVVENYAKDQISNEEVENYYNENIFGEITAKHILIKPETTTDMSDDDKKAKEEEALNKAKDLINELNNGADFDTLAKENSADTGSASEGGLIKDFTKVGDNSVVTEFWNAAYNLKDGEYTSEPVKSSFGYHIILKVSQNERPSLEDTKDDILDTLVTNKLKSDDNLSAKYWSEIRKKYNLNIIDSNIKKVYDDTIKNYEK